LEPDQLQKLGFSHQKARAMLELAQAISLNRLDLNELISLEDAAAVTRLRQLRGVGRWTAEYVLLRGLGRLNIFPGDDVGARNNLRRWRRLRESLDYAGVARTLARWQPYAGLIYFHLLLDSLTQKGLVP
ncbi:MAG: DNA-3-methyladenine glycosylase 2 family protein, partial [Anaerolineales bacterium]